MTVTASTQTIARHPEWCDHKSCGAPNQEGHTEHTSRLWDVTTGAYGVRMSVQQYEGEGLRPLIRIQSQHLRGALAATDVEPLIANLKHAAEILGRPAVPGDKVETVVAGNGAWTVTTSQTVTHPEWCDPRLCYQETPEQHPIHQSESIAIADAGQDFEAGFRQDGPLAPTLWTSGPSLEDDLTPAQVRAYAHALLALADKIDQPAN